MFNRESPESGFKLRALYRGRVTVDKILELGSGDSSEILDQLPVDIFYHLKLTSDLSGQPHFDWGRFYTDLLLCRDMGPSIIRVGSGP